MGHADGLVATRFAGRRAVRITALFAVAALVLSLGAQPVGAGAGKKKKRVERTESKDYVGATGVRGTQDTPCAGEPVGCVRFAVEPSERFVAIEVVDRAGMPIWASVYVNGYTDGTDAHQHVCGKSDGVFALARGLEELVVITTQTTGGATSECTGPATAGTVTATFSNIP